jgi:hypothetical protein
MAQMTRDASLGPLRRVYGRHGRRGRRWTCRCGGGRVVDRCRCRCRVVAIVVVLLFHFNQFVTWRYALCA